MTHKSGFVLLIGILVVTAIIILSASQFDRVANFVRQGSNKVIQQQAVNLAEAGVDYAIWQLNANAGNWYDSETEIAVGTTGTFFATATDASANIKNVVVTGYVPNSTSPRQKSTVKTQVVIDTETISFNYAVQVGTGGVQMDNNSTITGNVYSNKTGVSISGGNGSRITGSAFAVGTISSPDPTVTGTRHENQAASTMPTVNYQQWRDAAATGGTTQCSPTCTLSGSGNVGPKKYQGNLTFAASSTYSMKGPIYVTGDVILYNKAKLNLDSSFGSNGSVIIADGKIFVDNLAEINPTNSTPKGYILVISTSTADTNQVNCGVPDVNSNAICIDNNGVNAIFYALEGGATMDNNSGVASLLAKKLFLDNSATMAYQSGLASAQFTTGPGGSWVIRKGSYQYTK